MVDDNFFLYVLQGNMIFKVNKSDLKITGQAMLGMPGGPGQPGFRPGGGPPPEGLDSLHEG
jgi:hypothetical protein